MSEFFEVLGSGLHRMDDQLVTVVEDQSDQFNEPPCGIGSDHQPAPRIVFIIERSRVQDVGGGVEDSRVIESVTLVVLPRGLMQLRQRWPRTALRPGSPQNG